MLTFSFTKRQTDDPNEVITLVCWRCDKVMKYDEVEDHATNVHYRGTWKLTTKPNGGRRGNDERTT